MAQLETDIIQILMKARDQIRANMAAQGINASGRTSDSLHVREYAGGFQLVGGNDGEHEAGVQNTPTGERVIRAYDTAQIPTLENGRAGGKVPAGFYVIIKQWSLTKGLQFANESARSTFAYFVARRIAAQGTLRHAMPADVYTSTTRQAVDELRKAINASVADVTRAAVGAYKTTSLKR